MTIFVSLFSFNSKYIQILMRSCCISENVAVVLWKNNKNMFVIAALVSYICMICMMDMMNKQLYLSLLEYSLFILMRFIYTDGFPGLSVKRTSCVIYTLCQNGYQGYVVYISASSHWLPGLITVGVFHFRWFCLRHPHPGMIPAYVISSHCYEDTKKKTVKGLRNHDINVHWSSSETTVLSSVGVC